MFSRILVPLEHSPYDSAILAQVRKLAKLCGASLRLIHVADGWVAQNYKELKLRESEEMRRDREYLEKLAADLAREGFHVEAILAGGDPTQEILAACEREQCDLIAMATHGHRFLNDLVRGSVVAGVRHRATTPILLVRGSSDGSARGESAEQLERN
jgi:nucleotide-binding universal stress UspA family protein